MAFCLENVVPWGRSFDEYARMFALSGDDQRRSILGCADGPAAFHAELTRRGGQVVSCDPLYRFSTAEIRARIDATFTEVIEQTERNVDGFVWSSQIPDVNALGRVRMEAMTTFLEDFPSGLAAGRYVAAELPQLPFAEQQFDLALCSHFLFLYDSLGEAFHRRAVRELCRVAKEIRLFPLLQLDGQRSKFLEAILSQLATDRMRFEIVPVDYEFQRGANEMLRIKTGADVA